jgi:uroporphyrinogen decarboxylase
MNRRTDYGGEFADMKIRGLEDIIKKPQPDFNRLLKVLTRSGMPDSIPFYELYINTGVMERILDKKIQDRASTVEFYYKSGYDYVPVWPTFELKTGSLVDTSSHYPIKDWKSFEEYPWPDPSSIKYTEFESVIPVLPKGMKMIGQMWGVFETVQMLTGYTGLCYMLCDEPELVEAIFERVQVYYEIIYRGMSAIEQVGAVVISDDMGFNTQTLISVENLRKYVLPGHKALAQIVHESGKPCILHSCGQLSSIMEDIIEDVKIDAKHSYEDSILPVKEAIRVYGGRIAILGGIDVDRLCRSTGDDLREYVCDLLKQVAGKTGYALGSGNSIPDYVNIENYMIMLEEGWKLR